MARKFPLLITLAHFFVSWEKNPHQLSCRVQGYVLLSINTLSQRAKKTPMLWLERLKFLSALCCREYLCRPCPSIPLAGTFNSFKDFYLFILLNLAEWAQSREALIIVPVPWMSLIKPVMAKRDLQGLKATMACAFLDRCSLNIINCELAIFICYVQVDSRLHKKII